MRPTFETSRTTMITTYCQRLQEQPVRGGERAAESLPRGRARDDTVYTGCGTISSGACSGRVRVELGHRTCHTRL